MERHGHAGVSPVEGHQDSQGAEAEDVYEFVQPGEEKALGRP